jgi:single-stranded-DNA-specific exonuclease
MNAEWIIAPHATKPYYEALPEFHPLTAQTLFARGYAEPDQARAFITGDAPRVDPFALRDMRVAVDRILAAIHNGESIAVYGDYDCDGVTSCALLIRTLRGLNANAQVYIPDRFEEGYGLNAQALDKLKARNVSLVITVDCGARAVREAGHANAIGLDLVITDHHEFEGDTIPCALAVINPQRSDCTYPYKHLAGVGVAFRLAQALLRAARDAGMPRAGVSEAALLDFVAIGTVADVMELRGENRALVRAGLSAINNQPRAGVKALLNLAGVRQGSVTAGRIGFALGPRLNAAGRLESAMAAFDLLDCEDNVQAVALATKLELQNRERQSVTAMTARDAEQRAIGNGHIPALLLAASEEYNPGVIGLAAARLMEKHYRPSVVVSIKDGEARGSCRSVHGFHITQALDECRELFTRHGGHAAAAGFTLPSDRIDALRERMTHIAERGQPEGGWRRIIRADAEVHLSKLNVHVIQELELLEPHGVGNHKPVFVARGVRVLQAQRLGKSEGNVPPPHLKLKVTDHSHAPSRLVWDAVAWRMGDRVGDVPEGACIDMAFECDMNEWNGQRRVQLELKDFRVL